MNLTKYECFPKKARTRELSAWWYASRGRIDIYIDLGANQPTAHCSLTKQQLRRYLEQMDAQEPKGAG